MFGQNRVSDREYCIILYREILSKLKTMQEDREELARQIAELNKKIESLSATANEKKNTKKKNTGKTEFLTNQKRRDDEQ